MSAASITAEVEGVGGQPVSAQTIRCTYSQAWWWECHGLGLHECYSFLREP